MAVTMVTVVHTMTLIGETAPQDITVEVRPAARVWVPGETSSYLPRNNDVDVAADGTYTFEVPAVDDPALVGSNVTYQVTERTVPGPRGRQPPLQTVHRIAPTLAQAPGPVGLFDTLVTAPVPGGAGKFVDQIVDRAVDEAVDQITDDLGNVFAPTDHDHTRTDISDSTALGRTLMAVVDAGAGRDTLGIEVDMSVGTRVMVGGIMVHGDTGWRVVTTWGTDGVVTGNSLQAGLAPQDGVKGGVYWRRIGASVTMRLVGAKTSTALQKIGIPSGWDAGEKPFPTGVVAGAQEVPTTYYSDNSQIILRIPADLDVGRSGNSNGLEIAWLTVRTWPSTNLGTPV